MLACEHHQGGMILRGQVASWHQKQVVQETVRDMSQDELARLNCTAGLPLAPGLDSQRLLLQERVVVERMAYLAWEICRHRLERQSARLRSGLSSRRQ